MAKINPNDDKWNGGGGGGGGDRTPQCGTGDKLLAAVGYERYQSKTGKPMLGVRFLCLVDYEDESGGDAGAITFDNFCLTDAAMWRIVDYSRAVGYNEPFDPEEDGDTGKLLTFGFCIGHLTADTYNGKTTVRPGREGDTPAFRPAGQITEDPKWGAMIEAAEDEHRKYIDWRSKNPRGSGGYSGGGGGGGNAGASDDIPF